MKKKRIAQYCCAALVAAGLGLNIQNAIADYGIGQNSLSLVAGPGSNSNSNLGSNTNSDSNSNSNSNSNDLPAGWIIDKYMGKEFTITGGSVSGNVGVGPSGPSAGVGVSLNWGWVDCCKDNKHSACDSSKEKC